jgi:folate-binding protein YgfZ
MSYPSPLQSKLETFVLILDSHNEDVSREGAATGEYQPQLLCEFLPWGSAECEVLATTGIVELEYAAIQKLAGVFDAPCRGTIELRGKDRLSFIDRMSTQKLLDLKDGESRLAFVINRKGSIVADVIVRNLEDRVLLDLDITVIDQLCNHFTSYIVMDDVTFEDTTQSTHWLWCVGPKASSISIENAELYPLPNHFLGVDGVAIAVSPDQLENVWQSLVDEGVRPIGWYALNMARIENGAPIFLIDFDSENLPHETNLIGSRVRFDKGCYLGQEIVARMENLGKPKRSLMKLEIKSDDLPIAGAQLWEDSAAGGTPVGVVTSSAISPKGGSRPAVIVMIGKKFVDVGTPMFVYVGSDLVEGVVSPLINTKGSPE